MAYAAPVPSAPPVPDNGATPAAKYTKTWLNPGFYQWTVPSGVTVIGVTLAGGSGGFYTLDSGLKSYGGMLSDQLLNVSPNETLDIYVGQNGNTSGTVSYGYMNGGSGGYLYVFNGGSGYAGSGGGSSAVVASNTGQAIMAPGSGGESDFACSTKTYVCSFAGGGGGGGYTNGGNGGNGSYGVWWNYSGSGGSGGNGGGGNGGSGGSGGGNGGYSGGAGYNENGAPSGIIPGPGYPFVEIQWN